MCESDYECENNASARVSVFDRRTYIKNGTTRGYRPAFEMHAQLNEVYGTDTADLVTCVKTAPISGSETVV